MQERRVAYHGCQSSTLSMYTGCAVDQNTLWQHRPAALVTLDEPTGRPNTTSECLSPGVYWRHTHALRTRGAAMLQGRYMYV